MIRQLLNRLRDQLRNHRKMVIAFSGGVDSALLAAVAHDVLGANALAVTAVSPSLPQRERAAAREFARAHGIRHLEVCTDEGARPEYVANGPDRCHHCKSALLDALLPLATMIGAQVALGTNLDDLGDYRPGQRVASARGAIAPLVEAGFDKAAVREASALLGLRTAQKPAAACLASRVAYGDPVTPELLARIEAAERALHDLGFAVCRVRSHANGTVARVEVPPERIPAAAAAHARIDAAVRGAGFRFCALDLAGFRSGRMNELLPLSVARRSAG